MDYNEKMLDLFSGDLQEEEKKLLIQEYENNEEFQEDLKLQQEILYTIERGDDETIDFRNQLNDISNDFLSEKEPKRRINPSYWLAAASVIVVLGISSYLGLFRNNEYTGSQAFMEYYEPYGADLSVRGESHYNKLDKAISFYQDGNMALAISEFERLEKENAELAGFFTALCQMELGEISQAKNELERIGKNAIFYSDDIQWYLSLCYLKDNETNKASKILDDIANNNNQYSDKAKEILKKLKS